METRRRYRKRQEQIVTAIRLDVDTDGLVYRKWGGEQLAKRGDWLVDNAGDVYSVDAESFARTYRAVGPGRYLKTAPIWAEVAVVAGKVSTKEGVSSYEAGDYIVFNEPDGTDAYSVNAAKFEAMYELDS